ncbi:MAG: hypothetical protein ABJL54_04125 [Halioglobus sp.]
MSLMGELGYHRHWLLDFYDLAWEDAFLDMHLDDTFSVFVITV